MVVSIVLANRVSLRAPKPLKGTPPDTQNFRDDFFNGNLKHIIEFFHLHIIPMTLYKDIMLILINLYRFMVEI